MDARMETRRAYVEALINRLRRHYVDQTPLPNSSQGLSFDMLRQLCQYVLNEGYGENNER